MKEIKTEHDFKTAIGTDAYPHVIIDVYGPECGPCRELSPKLEKWTTLKTVQNIQVYKINIYENDETQKLCADWQVDELPTILFFSHGILRPLLTITGYEGQKTIDKLTKHATALLRLR